MIDKPWGFSGRKHRGDTSKAITAFKYLCSSLGTDAIIGDCLRNVIHQIPFWNYFILPPCQLLHAKCDMHTRTRAHAHTRTRAHAHTRTRAHAHTRTRAHAHTRTRAHALTRARAHARTHTPLYCLKTSTGAVKS